MGVKGLTPGRENSLGGITWFLGEMKGVFVVAQRSIKGGGAIKYYGALRREKVNFIVTQPESSKPPPPRMLCCEKRNRQKKSLFHDSSDTRENFEN